MFYQIEITKLLDDGLTPSQVVEHFNIPQIPLKYVLDVQSYIKSIYHEYSARTKHVKGFRKGSRNSQIAKIINEKVGSLTEFKRLVSRIGLYPAARQIGVNPVHMKDFMSFWGKRNHSLKPKALMGYTSFENKHAKHGPKKDMKDLYNLF